MIKEQVADDIVQIVKTGDALVGVRIGDHAYDAMAKVETVEEVTLDITGDNPRVIAVRLGKRSRRSRKTASSALMTLCLGGGKAGDYNVNRLDTLQKGKWH